MQREWDDLTVLASARRLFEPGTGYSYNNAGFSVAGAVIEAVSGQSYETFVRDRLLVPLGMPAAGFTADAAITHPVATPHWVFGDQAHTIRGAGWQPRWELGPVDRPAGGLIASVENLMTWCRFQQTGTAIDDSPILSGESLARLHTPVVRSDALDEIGLDWHVRASARTDLDDAAWQPPLDPPYTLGFFAEDHAVSTDPPGPPRVARFGFGSDGTAEWLQWSGRRAPRIG